MNMNREIRFRGKRLDTQEWEYGDLMRDNQGGCYVFPIEAENLYKEYEVDKSTSGQYTGLKDKNGKEIYEGDILKSAFSKKPFGVVAWNNGGGYFYILETFDFIEGRAECEHRPLGEMLTLDIDGQKVDFEVIGNIFDNPELLKEDGSK